MSRSGISAKGCVDTNRSHPMTRLLYLLQLNRLRNRYLTNSIGPSHETRSQYNSVTLSRCCGTNQARTSTVVILPFGQVLACTRLHVSRHSRWQGSESQTRATLELQLELVATSALVRTISMQQRDENGLNLIQLNWHSTFSRSWILMHRSNLEQSVHGAA